MAVAENAMDSFTTEELKVVTVSNDHDSQIAVYKRKYDHHLSSPIMEGKANKKLIARMDPQRRDGNLDSFLKRAKREKEQSYALNNKPAQFSSPSIEMMAMSVPDVAEESAEINEPSLIKFDSIVTTGNTNADFALNEEKEYADEPVAMAKKKKEVKDYETASKSKATRQYAAEPNIAKADDSVKLEELAISSAAAGASMEQMNSVQQFQWLTGKWEGNINNQVSVEQWNQVDAKTIEGRGFLIVNGQSTFNEDMKIQEIDGIIYFIADLSGTGEPVSYELVSNDGFEAIFENKSINFPNQVVLQRTNASNFQTIYQNTSPGNIDETQQNYLLNRNYIQKEQVIRNLRRVND